MGVLAEVLGVHIDVDQVDLEPDLLELNEQQYDSIYLFNDDHGKSFEEMTSLEQLPKENTEHPITSGPLR